MEPQLWLFAKGFRQRLQYLELSCQILSAGVLVQTSDDKQTGGRTQGEVSSSAPIFLPPPREGEIIGQAEVTVTRSSWLLSAVQVGFFSLRSHRHVFRRCEKVPRLFHTVLITFADVGFSCRKFSHRQCTCQCGETVGVTSVTENRCCWQDAGFRLQVLRALCLLARCNSAVTDGWTEEETEKTR